MSSEDHGTVFETLKHLEETPTADRIDTSGWLVHELDGGIANETHGAN